MQICTETFGAAPDVIISSSGAQAVKMPYIPTHLDYMLFELFKNSMRAVVDSCGSRRHLPAIHVTICPAPNSVTLRISDQASMIPFSSIANALCIFEFLKIIEQLVRCEDSHWSSPL